MKKESKNLPAELPKMPVVLLDDGVVYERGVFISDIVTRLNRTAQDMLAVGKKLLIVREKEGYGNFCKIIQDEIGLPLRSAYRFMDMAVKYERFPTLKVEKLKKTTVYELFELPEEELKELEETGELGGYDMDDIARMSGKEVREFARKLKKDVDGAVKQ